MDNTVSTLSTGVPQGVILSHLLFIIYINGISQATSASNDLFADNTYSFVVDALPTRLATRLQATIDSLSLAHWFDKWLLSVNIQKTAVIAFRTKGKNPVTLKTALHGQPKSLFTNTLELPSTAL